MAICGVASWNHALAVDESVLRQMNAALIRNPAVNEVSVVSHAGFGAGSFSPNAFLYSSEPVLVACSTELCNQRELENNVSLPPGNVASLIAALYLRDGENFLHNLRGTFAIAIWDTAAGTLLLARDRFGVMPLCYAVSGSEIVFCSYATGIFASGRVAKDVDHGSVVDFLTYSVIPAPRSAFKGVIKVNAGEYVVWKKGQVSSYRYWNMEYPENATGCENELARELLSLMEHSVRVNLAGLDAGRTGCFLSGGTDSSSIVGLASRLLSASVSTYSIGFSDEVFNELDYAHIAARHFNANHHESTVTPSDTYSAIETIARAYDEPFANSSAIPTYYCAKLAHDSGTEVLLAGDGGDELFGGNERYWGEQIYALYGRVPAPVRNWMIEPIVLHFPGQTGLFKRARNYIERANMPNPERFCILRENVLQHFPLDEVLDGKIAVPSDRFAVLRAYYEKAPARSELNRLLYIDIKMTLGDEDLRKVVRTAELASVRVRFPYLDHKLAEFSGRIPASLKLRGLKKRYLFKRATRNLLPKEILHKKKHGFSVPVGLWLKTDLKLRNMSRDVLLDPCTYQRGYFRRSFIEKLIADFEADTSPYAVHYGDLLFVFLMLELWHRYHVESDAQSCSA